MTVWCASRQEFMDLTSSALSEYRAVVEPFLLGRDHTSGYCRGCKRVTTFSVGPHPNIGDWRNLLEGMSCSCGLNGRMRLGLKIIDEICKSQAFDHPVVLERLTPLFPFLAERIPELIGCEFLGEHYTPGSMHDIRGVAVRHESLMSLSFGSASVDLLMHFDVIEHVPDALVAFEEIHRVLVTGGTMIFTCPFYHNLDHNILRATLKEGKIEHLLPPAYHGNPLSDQGSFVFIHPSWELIDMISSVGFSSVKIPVTYSVAEGIVSNGCPYPDGHMWPAVIVAKK